MSKLCLERSLIKSIREDNFDIVKILIEGGADWRFI